MLKKALTASCLLFAISAFLVVSVLALVEDSLFFQSDMRSAFIFVTAVSGMVFLILGAGVGLLLLFRPRLRARIDLHLGIAAACLIATGFLYVFLMFLDKEFRIFGLFRKPGLAFMFGVLWAVLLFGVWWLMSRSAAKRGIAHRTTLLATVGVPTALALFAVLVGFARLDAGSAKAGSQAPRHVVLVVLDAWPARYFRPFHPEAAAKPTDALFESGLAFTHFRTNAPWTNAFFGTLYKGSPRYSFTRRSLAERLSGRFDGGGRNLLEALQAEDVKTRVVAFHRNGLPEGSAATVSEYQGFRSVFSAVKFAPVLDILGLDYNLIIPTAAAETVWGDQRKRVLRDLLGIEPREYDNILAEALLPEMRRIRKSGERSFLLFHTGWELGKVDLPVAWAETDLPKGGGAVADTAKTRDYRYAPTEEWYAEEVRRKIEATAQLVSGKIAAFMQELGRQGLLDDTLLILTADHGTMAARGRLWYGYHPEEEVVRVPLVVLGAGRSGIEERNFESIDLTQTIIELFDGAGRLHDRARSIFAASPKPKDFTATATLRSDVNREWYLAIYKDDRKYLFNLHPDGQGQSLEQVVDGFTTRTVRQGPEVIQAVLPELRRALADYRLDSERLHPNFRALPWGDGPVS